MTLERVLDILAKIGDLDAEDIQSFQFLAEKNFNSISVDSSTLSESDDERLTFYVAAKTYYEIALILSSNEDVESFSAGDIKIDYGKNIGLAKSIYLSAREDVAGIISDSDFCFRSV